MELLVRWSGPSFLTAKSPLRTFVCTSKSDYLLLWIRRRRTVVCMYFSGVFLVLFEMLDGAVPAVESFYANQRLSEIPCLRAILP